MADEAIQGTFIPPAMGIGGTPIPLAGSGTLELTAEALVAKGFEGRSPVVVVLLMFLATTAAAPPPHRSRSRRRRRTCSRCATTASRPPRHHQAASARRKPSTKPWELTIPWSSIEKVAPANHAHAHVAAIQKQIQMKTQVRN